MIEIFVDGDACPVKDGVYAVAARLGLAVVVVANQRMNVPRDLGVELVVVLAGPDAADDWIAEEIREGDVVITADLPLAARCLAEMIVDGQSAHPALPMFAPRRLQSS